MGDNKSSTVAVIKLLKVMPSLSDEFNLLIIPAVTRNRKAQFYLFFSSLDLSEQSFLAG